MKIYPDNPFVGQEITVGGTIKYWDGFKWKNKTHGNHEKRLQFAEKSAAQMTLAEAQASDLKVGQYVRLTDYGNEIYVVASTVNDADDSLSIGGGLWLKKFIQPVRAVTGDVSTYLAEAKERLTVRGLTLGGDESQPTNDNAVMTISRCKNAVVSDNIIDYGYNSMTIGYGAIQPVGEERRTRDSVITQNIAKGHYMGFEAFSSARNSYTGNVAVSNKSDKGIQHGLRITGYGEDHLGQGNDLRNIGNAYVGFVLSNYANGVSQQTGAYGNLVSAAVSECTNGILFTENTTLGDAISKSNTHTFAISDVAYGGFVYDAKATSFRGTITGASVLGWNSIRGTRDLTANSYDLVITDCVDAAVFEDNNSYIKVVASDLQEGGVTVRGNYNIVEVVIDDQNISGATDAALVVSGAGNIVRICGYALRQQFQEVIISGTQNDVTINGNYTLPQGKIAVTGTDNTVRGYCHITATSNSNNDYTGVYKWQGVGSFSGTTDVNGRVDLGIHADMPESISGYALAVSSIEFTNPHLVVRKGANDAVLVLDAQTSAVVSNTSVNLCYSYICYK